jgi:hypothetical protein
MTNSHLHHLTYRAEAELKQPAHHEHHKADAPEPPLGSGTVGSHVVLFLAGLPSALVALTTRKLLKA